jgi:hypothetical protein
MADELEHVKRFRMHLRAEDKQVFDDLLNEYRHYASYASTMDSLVKEVPFFISMLFAQHKRIMELEKKIQQEKEKKKGEREGGLESAFHV